VIAIGYMKRAVVMLAAVFALGAAAPPAAAARSGPVTIDFGVATTNRDQRAARAAGTFTMTGRLADAGTIGIAFRFAGRRINSTATLIGTRGIFTIGLRGTLGGIVDTRQDIAGGWAVCGGTGDYRRLRGRGRWMGVTDFGAAPADMMPPAVRGAFLGRMHRRSMRTGAGFSSGRDAHC
jgi:hypothetical protein